MVENVNIVAVSGGGGDLLSVKDRVFCLLHVVVKTPLL